MRKSWCFTSVLLSSCLLAAACGSSEPSAESVSSTALTSSTTTSSTAAPKPAATAPTVKGPRLLFGTVRERNIDPKADGRDATAAVAGLNQFALDLYRKVGVSEPGNVVLGPYSALTALSMLYGGAAGKTADEIDAVLHTGMPADRWHVGLNAYDLTLDARTKGSPTTWRVANKIWAQQGLALQPAFLDLMVSRYGAPVAEADFASNAEAERAIINTWVSESTNKLITELFPKDSIDPNTVLALVNAVALDAPWEFPFDPANTRSGSFTTPDGPVTVPMMSYNEFLPSGRGDDFQAVELPYGGGALSMVVIMPTDFAKFESKFDTAALGRVTGSIKDGGIHLTMPKWTARTHVQMNKVLSELGMPSAFGDADFSAMTGAPGLVVSTVEHEAFIEVDEKGTRSAAATGGAMLASHGPTVRVDKPFLYVVRDKGSGAVLFIGRVLDPSRTA
jgi:serpin B